MPYVIRKAAMPRHFVAAAGSPRSYTPSLQQARRFDTKDEAEAERCPENERIEFVPWIECVGWLAPA